MLFGCFVLGHQHIVVCLHVRTCSSSNLVKQLYVMKHLSHTTPTLLCFSLHTNKQQCFDNDNDHDTLREVPHLSDEGLALQARASGAMAPRKRICLTGEACSVGKVQEQTVMDRVYCTMVNSKFKEEKGHVLAQAVAVLNSQ